MLLDLSEQLKPDLTFGHLKLSVHEMHREATSYVSWRRMHRSKN